MANIVASLPTGMSKIEDQSLKKTATNTDTNQSSINPTIASRRGVSPVRKQQLYGSMSTDTNPKSSTTSSSISKLPSGRDRSKSPLSTKSTSQSSASLSSKMHVSSTTPSNLSSLTKSTETSTTSNVPTPGTIDRDFNFNETYNKLSELAEINCNYFSQYNDEVCRRFSNLFAILSHSMELSMPLATYLIENFHRFDYSNEIRANGYRTLVVSHGHACLKTLDILRQVDNKRAGLLFNLMHSSRLLQELDAWTKTVVGMQHILSFAAKLISFVEKDGLYVDVSQLPFDIELDYFKMVAFDSESYFGKTCGFQFHKSVEKLLSYILAGLATFYEAYNQPIPIAAANVATAPKYILFPEQRAAKCAIILRDCDYLFCKAFWNIPEHDLVKIGSKVITPNVTVSKYFQIGPTPIEINSIVVQPPMTDTMDANHSVEHSLQSELDDSNNQSFKTYVNIKLLSNSVREGMEKLPLNKADFETSSKKVLPMSDELLMHMHGGGFIATSSTTHEVYLKPWAISLQIPVVSVDYSLAPECPFPRAVDECFYTYAWILQNAEKLGWSGKRILLVGDSAGGNLATAVTIKAIEAGLRIPDVLICFYTPFLLSYSISPSRLMAIADPLLNTGFLWRCLAAYIGIRPAQKLFDDKSSKETVTNDRKSEQVHSSNTEKPQKYENRQDDKEDDDDEFTELDDKEIFLARLIEIMGPRQANLLRQLRDSKVPYNPHMSPMCASDKILRQFPTTYLIPCSRDPLIDDSVEFARRLRSLNVPHHLIVVDEWPHGYLDFGFASTEIAQYNSEVISMLQNIIRQSNLDESSDSSSATTFTS